MRYTKEARNTGTKSTKPKPPNGWHRMKIMREMPNTKNQDLHTLILESKDYSLFWNVWVNALEKVGECIGIVPDVAGVLDTSGFTGKEINVFVEDKQSKDGSSVYKNVREFAKPAPTTLPPPAETTTTDLSDIPF